MAVGIFYGLARFSPGLDFGVASVVFIALNLSCLKAEIRERSRHGNGLSCFRERGIRGEG